MQYRASPNVVLSLGSKEALRGSVGYGPYCTSEVDRKVDHNALKKVENVRPMSNMSFHYRLPDASQRSTPKLSTYAYALCSQRCLRDLDDERYKGFRPLNIPELFVSSGFASLPEICWSAIFLGLAGPDCAVQRTTSTQKPRLQGRKTRSGATAQSQEIDEAFSIKSAYRVSKEFDFAARGASALRNRASVVVPLTFLLKDREMETASGRPPVFTQDSVKKTSLTDPSNTPPDLPYMGKEAEAVQLAPWTRHWLPFSGLIIAAILQAGLFAGSLYIWRHPITKPLSKYVSGKLSVKAFNLLVSIAGSVIGGAAAFGVAVGARSFLSRKIVNDGISLHAYDGLWAIGNAGMARRISRYAILPLLIYVLANSASSAVIAVWSASPETANKRFNLNYVVPLTSPKFVLFLPLVFPASFFSAESN
ncbi:hypothetical protein T439DRAFT_61511 [Meredithblackwellia eburnea MCA 4105]